MNSKKLKLTSYVLKDKMITFDAAIRLYSTQLKEISESPLLDTEILLCDTVCQNRAWLRSHGKDKISEKSEKILLSLIERRKLGEPIAYIRGFCDFYGRHFIVNKHVLVPRPESETMIELAKKLCDDKKSIKVGDIGCGSGALGISLALEVPYIDLHMFDISKDALSVAKKNSSNHKVVAAYHQGNLLESCMLTYDMLLCNLPYVPTNYPINAAATHEPKLALFAGEDGLDLYRTLFEQLGSGSYGSPIVLTESLLFQHNELKKIAMTYDYQQTQVQDLIQVFRPINKEK